MSSNEQIPKNENFDPDDNIVREGANEKDEDYITRHEIIFERNGMTKEDATELATLQKEEANLGDKDLSPEKFKRLLELRKKYD
ncbi:hypothetical protein HOE31_05030 [bacterium]|jgi:hypothetical protein|nr:hypothetical protein [bacterium]MBT4122284.1 hypothetical protein [bacterium]MBT4495749.1 hypothetical protein [bacterium]MBT4764139.1 hypothetical protein [bacterium]MBT5401511.1 hypothetical protein [bacterium]